MRTLEKVVYTAHTHTAGGREGWGRSSDDQLDVKLSTPGSSKPGTNPEQLFGIGYSACFMGAIQLAGGRLGIRVPDGVAVDAEVSLGKTAGDAAYALAVKLSVTLPGLSDAQKWQLVEGAHQTCPYSNATRGNIEVEFAVA